MRKIFPILLFFPLFFLRLQLLSKLDLKEGQVVRVTGSLAEEPQISNNRQKINLGQFEIWTERYPEYHYGDQIEVVGKTKVQNLKFKVQSYLLEEAEVKSTTSITSTTSVTRRVTGTAINLKLKLKDFFQKSFSSPLDGLISGIVLGDKSLIPQDFWQKLQQTGTLHIMVASGMNIAMFSNGLLKFFLLLVKRKLAVILVISVIWFYCLMAGMQAPIIRAGIMASLIYLSVLLGREAEGGRILFLTGGLMLLINPFLLWDIGFQLSFLATAGLVYVGPKIQNKVGIKNEDFTSSVSSLIMTLPILVINFGQVNVLSPLINFVILWTIPLILKAGMVIGMMGILWIRLGEISSYLIFPVLLYLEQAINLFAKLTFFQVQMPKMGWWWGIVYYLVIWWWLRRVHNEV